jgi:hypothetical protein
MRFIAAALAAIQPGARGIVAIPVKANWGPVKQVVEITSEKDLVDILGTDTGGGFTAYTCVRMCLLGRPKTILAYRLADGSEAKAGITLKDSAALDVLRLTTKYETTRDFKVAVQDSIQDETKQDIVLYEGARRLHTYTFAKGAAVVDNAVAAVSDGANNVWLEAQKLAAGSGTIANVATQPLTGGNAGVAVINNADYLDAMNAFEGRPFNGFALDGTTEASLQASVRAWVERLRDEGKKVIAYLGGSAVDDQTPATANTRSAGFNHEGVVNVGTSVKLAGTWYPSAVAACYVAGRGTGQRLAESLTYAATPFADVAPRLTHNQVVQALQSGTLVFVHDGEKVIIEQGINTLSSLREGQGRAWRKIKPIRIMDAIDMDTAQAAHDNYIGKVLNNEDGQAAVLSAIKNYFETLSPALLAPDFVVETDKALQANAESDEFFWRYEATIIDSMEKIFGTGYIK